MKHMIPALALAGLLGATPAHALNAEQRKTLAHLITDQVARCFMAPAPSWSKKKARLEIRLRRDGSLLEAPKVLEPSPDSDIAKAAVRAVQRCAPFRIPDRFQGSYNEWKLLNMEFESEP
jgi:TolA C-terminal.